MKVKQADIAKKLGISRTTVARALNGSGSINESRKEEILKLADEMGYTKNTVGSVLATKKQKVIYIFVVKSINRYYLEEIYKGLKKIELEFNYLKFNFKYVETSISNPEEQAEKLNDIIENEEVDGVIITPLIKKDIKKVIMKYDKKISFLMLDSYLCKDIAYVGSNYFGNAKLAANLIDKVLRKNEKVLLFDALDDNISSKEYYRGFKEYIKNTDKNVIELGTITKDGSNIFEHIKPYVNSEEIIAIYAPRYADVLIDVIASHGLDFNKIKIITQSKGSAMEKYLKENAVIAIIEERIDEVSYRAGKYMIENIYNNKEISNIKEYIQPEIIIAIDNNY